MCKTTRQLVIVVFSFSTFIGNNGHRYDRNAPYVAKSTQLESKLPHLVFFLYRTFVVVARAVIVQDITNVELLGVRKDGYGDI